MIKRLWHQEIAGGGGEGIIGKNVNFSVLVNYMYSSRDRGVGGGGGRRGGSAPNIFKIIKN